MTSLKLKALLCKLPETLSWTWDVSSPSPVTSQSQLRAQAFPPYAATLRCPGTSHAAPSGEGVPSPTIVVEVSSGFVIFMFSYWDIWVFLGSEFPGDFESKYGWCDAGWGSTSGFADKINPPAFGTLWLESPKPSACFARGHAARSVAAKRRRGVKWVGLAAVLWAVKAKPAEQDLEQPNLWHHYMV